MLDTYFFIWSRLKEASDLFIGDEVSIFLYFIAQRVADPDPGVFMADPD